MTEHELQLLKNLEHRMATLDDQLAAITTSLANLTAEVQSIAKPEDLTPVTTALATLQAGQTAMEAQITAIAAKLPVDAS
jgi:hypothetical protein